MKSAFGSIRSSSMMPTEFQTNKEQKEEKLLTPYFSY